MASAESGSMLLSPEPMHLSIKRKMVLYLMTAIRQRGLVIEVLPGRWIGCPRPVVHWCAGVRRDANMLANVVAANLCKFKKLIIKFRTKTPRTYHKLIIITFSDSTPPHFISLILPSKRKTRRISITVCTV